jgi:DNA transformation protein
VTQDALYLKADPESRDRFEAAGGRRFEYTRAGKTQCLEFWTPPADAMDSPALMQPWAQLALAAALRARAASRRPR